MRSIVLILAICISIHSTAQPSFGVHSKVGQNKIGVLYELGGSCQFKNHGFILGARFYEPDLVFEQNYPGLSLGYDYSFRSNKKMKIIIGGTLGIFCEKKLITTLWLFDPKMILGPSWNLSDHFKLELLAGFGTTVNAVNSEFYENKSKFTYLNYELALGLKYHFGVNSVD